MPFTGNTLGHQLSFCFTQRLISLHWTVKCRNLFLLGPDGSWMAVKIPTVLNHSPWGLLFCSMSSQELMHYHSGELKILCCKVSEENADYRSFFFANWNLLCVSCCTEPCAPWMCCFWSVCHLLLLCMWDCDILGSMCLCYAGLVLEQGAGGTKAAKAKINSHASNNILPVTSAFIK